MKLLNRIKNFFYKEDTHQEDTHQASALIGATDASASGAPSATDGPASAYPSPAEGANSPAAPAPYSLPLKYSEAVACNIKKWMRIDGPTIVDLTELMSMLIYTPRENVQIDSAFMACREPGKMLDYIQLDPEFDFLSVFLAPGRKEPTGICTCSIFVKWIAEGTDLVNTTINMRALPIPTPEGLRMLIRVAFCNNLYSRRRDAEFAYIVFDSVEGLEGRARKIKRERVDMLHKMCYDPASATDANMLAAGIMPVSTMLTLGQKGNIVARERWTRRAADTCLHRMSKRIPDPSATQQSLITAYATLADIYFQKKLYAFAAAYYELANLADSPDAVAAKKLAQCCNVGDLKPQWQCFPITKIGATLANCFKLVPSDFSMLLVVDTDAPDEPQAFMDTADIWKCAPKCGEMQDSVFFYACGESDILTLYCGGEDGKIYASFLETPLMCTETFGVLDVNVGFATSQMISKEEFRDLRTEISQKYVDGLCDSYFDRLLLGGTNAAHREFYRAVQAREHELKGETFYRMERAVQALFTAIAACEADGHDMELADVIRPLDAELYSNVGVFDAALAKIMPMRLKEDSAIKTFYFHMLHNCHPQKAAKEIRAEISKQWSLLDEINKGGADNGYDEEYCETLQKVLAVAHRLGGDNQTSLSRLSTLLCSKNADTAAEALNIIKNAK